MKEPCIQTYITTIKTADSLIIELNDHSKAILEKQRYSIQKR